MSKLKKAMEKAKAERDFDTELYKQELPSDASAVSGEKEVIDTGVEEFFVEYSKTRVQPVDPDVLKRNKILSLFHEYRETDLLNALRTQVLNSLEKMPGNSLLVTSANPGEGKTFVAINLGFSIAHELDRTVLIVDADMRKPARDHCNFSKDFFGLNGKVGLSDYLTGRARIEDLLINPGINKITILPAGSPVANSAELLGSPRMEKLVLEMRERYDERIVIFDTPALLTCTDPLVFSHSVDGVLLVVEAEKTTPSDVRHCLELLEGCTILGTVFNKAEGVR